MGTREPAAEHLDEIDLLHHLVDELCQTESTHLEVGDSEPVPVDELRHLAELRLARLRQTVSPAARTAAPQS